MRVIDVVAGGLIVSCQAYPGEPMRDPQTLTNVALAAVEGGAAGIRAQGIADLRAMRSVLDVPLIGLWKDGHDGVFITPTLEHALAVAETGADVVALDGTRRTRPDGRSLAETITGLREAYPDVIVMADCGSLDDARASADAGADWIGTTLAGYTGEREKTVGPDLDLVAAIARDVPLPLVAEGRLHSPADARAALDAGATTVVVGTAITHPTTITGWFLDAMRR